MPLDPLEWRDIDRDGIGDNSDEDDDGDGILDVEDADPLSSSLVDQDSDGDGVIDRYDVFPFNAEISGSIKFDFSETGLSVLAKPLVPIKTNLEAAKVIELSLEALARLN